MDFKTNPDIFLLWSTILVSDSFGRGDGAISTKQSNSSRTPKLFNAEKRLVVIFRPDNLGDQI
jgi:hypothetical protein